MISFLFFQCSILAVKNTDSSQNTEAAITAPTPPKTYLKWTSLDGIQGLNTNGSSIAIDPSGNTCVTGQTFASLDSQTVKGNGDVFVTTRLYP